MPKKSLISTVLFLLVLAGCQQVAAPEKNYDSVQNSTLNSETEGAVGVVVNGQKLVNPTKEELQSLTTLNKPAGHNPGLREGKIQEVKDLIGKKPVAVLLGSKNCIICDEIQAKMKNSLPLLPDGIELVKVDITEDTEWVKANRVVNSGEWLIFNYKGDEVARNSGLDYNSLLQDFRRGV